MKPWLALVPLLLIAGWLLPADTVPFHPPLTAEEKQQIEKAVPARAPAQPKKPRKILVTTLSVNKQREVVAGHASIPYGNYAIAEMGKRTGAYEVVFSTDIEMLRPGVIDQFDAICMNNTMGVLFDDAELKASLLGFIAGGKGFIGFHAAAATFVQYPVYDQGPPFGKMVGGTENGGHPWGPKEEITIRGEEADHVLNRGFTTTQFPIADEVFQFQEAGLRERFRVLLSIDPERTDMGPKRRILPIRRADLDFPMTWIKPHGKGRVFYSSFGHNPHVFWHKELLTHFLARIQYALGDLEADDRPNAVVAAEKAR